jgi:hypothetical protein
MEKQISSQITLDAETARVMAENDEGSIHLERIETLNVETARALAGAKMWSGKLPRLTSLSVETARALAQSKGTNLSLDGLTSIDVDTARALAGFTTHPEEDADGSGQKFRGVWLGLNGLETLDAATAKALTAFKGEHTYLYLKGLKSLSVDAARALGEFEGHELHLGLPKLTGDLAAVMAAFKCGRLYFRNSPGSMPQRLRRSPPTAAGGSRWAASKDSPSKPHGCLRVSRAAICALTARGLRQPMLPTRSLISKGNGSG